mgnify:CR=1 FL=1|tara:strand:- start:19 stop:1089 length:1071 start_codon:yes stop_codon:yes gene_type:complete
MNFSAGLASLSLENKKIVHHLNGLGMGGSEGMTQILLSYLSKNDIKYDHYLAYRTESDKDRLPFFRESLGSKNIFGYGSNDEFKQRMEEMKPFALHRVSAGIPEFPFVPEVKKHVKHFVSTSVFADQDNSIEISKVIYVSQHLKLRAGFGNDPDHVVLRNSIEAPADHTNLREELKIPKDAFVFGKIGRDDANIYDPINIEAYAQVATDNTFFILVNAGELARADCVRLNLPNVIFLDPTFSKTRLSQFYNTIDVLADARKDGHCNAAVHWESAAHGKPVISHYGTPYNGMVETIQDTGFVVLPGDVDEYARIMKAFVDGVIDYKALSQKSVINWQNTCTPRIIGKKYIKILDSLV